MSAFVAGVSVTGVCVVGVSVAGVCVAGVSVAFVVGGFFLTSPWASVACSVVDWVRWVAVWRIDLAWPASHEF